MPVKIAKILYPFDIASKAADELVVPLRIARAFQARIEFCFVLAKGSRDGIVSAELQLNQVIRKTFSRLSKSQEDLAVDWGAVVSEADDTEREIVTQAARSKADLIIIKGGRSTIPKTCTLGSVTETICRTAPCSVLVIHPEAYKSRDKKDHPIFERILVAYDFSDYSELALQSAELFGERFHSEGHFLHVLSEPIYENMTTGWSNEASGRLYHQTIQRLHTAIAPESSKFRKVAIATRWGKIYQEILKYADEQQVDLILLGAHGLDFGMGTLFGSNTDRVLRQASQPILIARPLYVDYPYNLMEISRPNLKDSRL